VFWPKNLLSEILQLKKWGFGGKGGLVGEGEVGGEWVPGGG